MDEGYIKFECEWERADAEIPKHSMGEINKWRSLLLKMGLIGMYDNGVGYGNMSVRSELPFFYITGTATGGIGKLSEKHFARVTSYDFARNKINCIGMSKASSESLTHAAVFECEPEALAVIHIHSKELWQKMLFKIPTTKVEVAYGTPEMAFEIRRLYETTDLRFQKIMAMGGHEEGLISFGETLGDAFSVIMQNLI
jgi:hypothetical protein